MLCVPTSLCHIQLLWIVSKSQVLICSVVNVSCTHWMNCNLIPSKMEKNVRSTSQKMKRTLDRRLFHYIAIWKGLVHCGDPNMHQQGGTPQRGLRMQAEVSLMRRALLNEQWLSAPWFLYQHLSQHYSGAANTHYTKTKDQKYCRLYDHYRLSCPLIWENSLEPFHTWDFHSLPYSS
jgi:hypothetical protein